jgi:hypothetical protein
VGLDWMIKGITPCAAFLLLAVAGCDDETRPDRLLNGQPAAEFRPVEGSVVSQTRVLRAEFLGRRLTVCLASADRASFPPDTVVVERVGVFAESLTFLDRGGRHVYGCDGGIDASGERPKPWCGGSVGRLHDGRLLDPRLDVLCRDSSGKPLAYAWIEPAAGSHWIGVDQGSYMELYEIAAGLPVRIASARRVDRQKSRATFEVTQYDERGRELLKGEVEAAVAG